jgi:hypothetical protein
LYQGQKLKDSFKALTSSKRGNIYQKLVKFGIAYSNMPQHSVMILQAQVYIFEFFVKICLFCYPVSEHCENNFVDSYVVDDPKGHVLWVRGLFCNFPNFSKEYNSSPPHLHLKYKKSY